MQFGSAQCPSGTISVCGFPFLPLTYFSDFEENDHRCRAIDLWVYGPHHRMHDYVRDGGACMQEPWTLVSHSTIFLPHTSVPKAGNTSKPCPSVVAHMIVGCRDACTYRLGIIQREETLYRNRNRMGDGRGRSESRWMDGPMRRAGSTTIP